MILALPCMSRQEGVYTCSPQPPQSSRSRAFVLRAPRTCEPPRLRAPRRAYAAEPHSSEHPYSCALLQSMHIHILTQPRTDPYLHTCIHTDTHTQTHRYTDTQTRRHADTHTHRTLRSCALHPLTSLCSEHASFAHLRTCMRPYMDARVHACLHLNMHAQSMHYTI